LSINGKKIGVALGGGYARGLAHIGVLEVLEREGIPIDIIAGTSAGALIGAIYARQMNANLIKEEALALDWKRVMSLVDLVFGRSGFIAGKRVIRLLEDFIGEETLFSDLKLPFSCVATDIITGEEVVIKEGRVLEAVRSSISIPIIFQVSRWQDRFLVDGGLVNPVPVSIAREMGADYVIAVNVIPEMAERSKARRLSPSKEPGIFTVIANSIYISSYYLSNRILEDGAHAVISPLVANIGPGEFHRAAEAILQGELAALDAVAEIKKQLKSLASV